MKIHMPQTKNYTQHNSGKKSLIFFKMKSTIKTKEDDFTTIDIDVRSHLLKKEMKSIYYEETSKQNDQVIN